MPITKRAFLVNSIAAFAVAVFSRKARANSQSGVNHEVKILDFKYVPYSLEVKPGDTNTWINLDTAPHTATALDRNWDTGWLEKDEEGTVHVVAGMPTEYYCTVHPAMRAEIKFV